MKVFVSGIHGQLAQSLKVQSSQIDTLDFVFAGRPEFDLANSNAINSLLNSEAPDVVINAAAYTAVDQAEDEPELAQKINCDAPGAIAKITDELGCKLIQISTDYVFDGEKPTPYNESDQTNPTGVYGQTKLAGEIAVRDNNPEHVIVRTAWVYSPFGNNFMKTMIRLAEARDDLSVVDDQRGNPTSALDIADGLLAILNSWQQGELHGLGGTYHLSGSGDASWAEFAEAIFQLSKESGGPFCEVTKIPSSEFPTKAKRPMNSRLNCEKFETVFGYRTPDWRQSLAKLIAG